MEIQLSIFLIIYVVFLVLILANAFFNLYHILFFGFASFWSYLLIFSYVFILILVLGLSFYLIAQYDWTESISILKNNNFNF